MVIHVAPFNSLHTTPPHQSIQVTALIHCFSVYLCVCVCCDGKVAPGRHSNQGCIIRTHRRQQSSTQYKHTRHSTNSTFQFRFRFILFYFVQINRAKNLIRNTLITQFEATRHAVLPRGKDKEVKASSLIVGDLLLSNQNKINK